MAVLMAAAMLAVHTLRAHLSGHGSPMRPGVIMTIAGAVLGLVLRIGVKVSILGPMQLLTVRGRSSGRERTVPVDVHEIGGRRYLIATHGVGAWVLNLRSAGEGRLRLGRRSEWFRARELSLDEAAPILAGALGRLVASDGWRGRGVRANLNLQPHPTTAGWRAAAAGHPVFEVLPR